MVMKGNKNLDSICEGLKFDESHAFIVFMANLKEFDCLRGCNGSKERSKKALLAIVDFTEICCMQNL